MKKAVLSGAFALAYGALAHANIPVAGLKKPPVDSLVSKIDIYGSDDRKEQTRNNNLNRRVGRLITTFSTGDHTNRLNACSAQLIGPDHLITAAHCITQFGTVEFPARITFDPQAIRGSEAQHPREFATDVWVTRGWKNAQPTSEAISHELASQDIAIIRLKKFDQRQSVGDRLGWFDIKGSDMSGEIMHGFTIGYPGDKADNTLWKTPCSAMKSFWSPANLLKADCDTFSGQSGGGFFEYDENSKDYRIRAVLSSSTKSRSHYARISSAQMRDIIRIVRDGRSANLSQFYHHSVNDIPSYFVHMKNDCRSKIWIALRVLEPQTNSWKSRGWIEASPGQTLFAAQSASSYFYYYAATADGEKVWSGKHQKYLASFVKKELPLLRHQTPANFRDYTLRLTCH